MQTEKQDPAYPPPPGVVYADPVSQPPPGYPGHPPPGYHQPHGSYGQPQPYYPPPQQPPPQQAAPAPIIINNAMQQQSSGGTVVVARSTESDCLVWSILNCLFCNFLLGIIAIVFSALARQSFDEGDVESGRTKKKVATALNITSLVLGIIAIIVGVVVGVVATTSTVNRVTSGSGLKTCYDYYSYYESDNYNYYYGSYYYFYTSVLRYGTYTYYTYSSYCD